MHEKGMEYSTLWKALESYEIAYNDAIKSKMACEDKLSQLGNICRALRNENEATVKENARLLECCIQLRQELMAKDDNLSAMQKTFTDATANNMEYLSRLGKRNQELEKERINTPVRMLESKIADLERRLILVTEEKNSAQNENHRLNMLIDELQLELKGRDETMREIQLSITETSSRQTEHVSRLKSNIKSLRDENTILSRQLIQSRECVANISSQVESISCSIEPDSYKIPSASLVTIGQQVRSVETEIDTSCGFDVVVSENILDKFNESDHVGILRHKLLNLPRDGRAFEAFCCDLFDCLGYKTTQCGKAADNGIDFILRSRVHNSTWKAVGQCKRYNCKVSAVMIREFLGAMWHAESHSGFFMTTSTYTRNAKETADKLLGQNVHIELWDIDRICQAMEPYATTLLQKLNTYVAADSNKSLAAEGKGSYQRGANDRYVSLVDDVAIGVIDNSHIEDVDDTVLLNSEHRSISKTDNGPNEIQACEATEMINKREYSIDEEDDTDNVSCSSGYNAEHSGEYCVPSSAVFSHDHSSKNDETTVETQPGNIKSLNNIDSSAQKMTMNAKVCSNDAECGSAEKDLYPTDNVDLSPCHSSRLYSPHSEQYVEAADSSPAENQKDICHSEMESDITPPCEYNTESIPSTQGIHCGPRLFTAQSCDEINSDSTTTFCFLDLHDFFNDSSDETELVAVDSIVNSPESSVDRNLNYSVSGRSKDRCCSQTSLICKSESNDIDVSSGVAFDRDGLNIDKAYFYNKENVPYDSQLRESMEDVIGKLGSLCVKDDGDDECNIFARNLEEYSAVSVSPMCTPTKEISSNTSSPMYSRSTSKKVLRGHEEWSDDEVKSLLALIKEYQKPNGMIPWAQIQSWLEFNADKFGTEQYQSCAIKPGHFDKNKLRYKWKNDLRNMFV